MPVVHQEHDPSTIRTYFAMTRLDTSRRAFLRTLTALAGTAPLMTSCTQAQTVAAEKPLIAYVGTFSSPLRDVLPTQVDLPPGNGREMA